MMQHLLVVHGLCHLEHNCPIEFERMLKSRATEDSIVLPMNDRKYIDTHLTEILYSVHACKGNNW